MERVQYMFLPMHLTSVTLGISISFCQGKTISFDDGFYFPIPEELKRNSKEILEIIFKMTRNVTYSLEGGTSSKVLKSQCCINQPTTLEVARWHYSTQSQKKVSIKGIGLNKKYSWKYKSEPTLRRELMVEIWICIGSKAGKKGTC